MKKYLIVAIAVILVIGAYIYWPNHKLPDSVIAVTIPPQPSIPEVRKIVEQSPELPTLPNMSQSDDFIFNALSELINDMALIDFIHSKRIIHNIVATIDNLPRRDAPLSVMPLKRVKGGFITEGEGESLIISQNNAARYTPYIRIFEAVDPTQLVQLYIRLYPLFQQAFEELGYPTKYFNDRLMVALDDLLAAPEIMEPVKLIQPKVYFKFSDPNLEGRSIGQRILMRIGSNNERIIKNKLVMIKQQLLLRLHEQPVASGKL